MQMLAVVYFPKTGLDRINSFREKYDANWRIIPPHITIVSPLSEPSEERLIEHVEKAAETQKSFCIHLEELIKTQDGCLFLTVGEGKSGITKLHDNLYSGILAPYIPTDYPFAPHITLGEFAKVDDALLTTAYTEAQGLSFNLTYEFDALTIIKGDDTRPAEIVKVINLGIGGVN